MSTADRVRAALRGEVEARALFDALWIALEALEQAEEFAPGVTQGVIERMADVLEGKNG